MSTADLLHMCILAPSGYLTGCHWLGLSYFSTSALGNMVLDVPVRLCRRLARHFVYLQILGEESFCPMMSVGTMKWHSTR